MNVNARMGETSFRNLIGAENARTALRRNALPHRSGLQIDDILGFIRKRHRFNGERMRRPSLLPVAVLGIL